MLLELRALSQVPRPHSVVQSSRPQLCPVRRDVNAAGSSRVSLELPDQGLVVEIPHCDVPVGAAAKAHLAVRADGQRVVIAGGAWPGQVCLDALGYQGCVVF